MDLLRGAAVLLVIAWHVIALPGEYGVAPGPALVTFFDATVSVRMPLMFLLSGMLLPLALSKSPSAYVIGKYRNLLWPYAMWFMVMVVITGSWSTFTSFWKLVGGPWHLWFLAVLIACFVVARALRRIPGWIVAAMMQVGLHLGDFSTAAVERFLYFGSFFFLGSSLWHARHRIAALGWWLPATLATLGTAATLSLELLAPAWAESIVSLGALLRSLPWLILLLWLGPRLPRGRFLEWAGRQSIVLYLVHFAAIVALLQWTDAELLPPAVLYLVVAVLGFGVPLVLARHRHAVPWLFRAPGMPTTRPVGR